MKTFYYMGPSEINVSGVSWKIWRVSRAGKQVTTSWGAAKIVNRRVVPVGQVQSKARHFSSAEEAAAYERDRVQSKLRKGYQRSARRK